MKINQRTLDYKGIFRAFVPSPDTQSIDHQAWFEDHQQYRWNVAQKLTAALADGKVTPEEWADLFDQMLLEGHANSWWIGRHLGGDTSEFGEADLIAGRRYKDVESEFLEGFLDDIENGVFTDEDGKLNTDAINYRARMYVNKFRGTAYDAFVDSSPEDADWYWRLGSAEEHCSSCPALAAMSEEVPFKTHDLPTTPGAGDTECLTNCLCHLERVVNGVSVIGFKPVALELDNDSSKAA